MSGSLRELRLIVVATLLAATAACSSSASQTVSAGSGSGSATQVAGVFSFGPHFSPRYLGRWTMSDRFARSCTYIFENEPMQGSTRIAAANPSGYCTRPFDAVAGWRVIGRDIELFDATGEQLARLSPNGEDNFFGRFRGPTLRAEVILRRGFV